MLAVDIPPRQGWTNLKVYDMVLLQSRELFPVSGVNVFVFGAMTPFGPVRSDESGSNTSSNLREVHRGQQVAR